MLCDYLEQNNEYSFFLHIKNSEDVELIKHTKVPYQRMNVPFSNNLRELIIILSFILFQVCLFELIN